MVRFGRAEIRQVSRHYLPVSRVPERVVTIKQETIVVERPCDTGCRDLRVRYTLGVKYVI